MTTPNSMTTTFEVFADITCPFTHVGLRVIRAELAAIDRPITCRVRAWPLEWVNGEPMQGKAVADKASDLRQQLGEEYFVDFDPDNFPESTIPALNLTASAYEIDVTSGLNLSLEIRHLLFEQGKDVSAPSVLTSLAAKYGLDTPSSAPSAAVLADYKAGQDLQVLGSPHFFLADGDYFCPSLDLERDAEGNLKAQFDATGIADFLSRI